MTKRMTKAQRAQVVELLRCAADVVTFTLRPISCAAFWLGLDESAASDAALRARADVGRSNHIPPADDEAYRTQILEAALRVELGEWPPHTHERGRRRG